MTDERFIAAAVDAGCRLFFFMEYTPIQEGTEEWVITEPQREGMRGLVAGFRRRFPAVFIAVPWDEEQTGGCLASGRGFVHISATGDLEPCPFAPYSDVNLKELSLRAGAWVALPVGHAGQPRPLRRDRGRLRLVEEPGAGRELLASCGSRRSLNPAPRTPPELRLPRRPAAGGPANKKGSLLGSLLPFGSRQLTFTSIFRGCASGFLGTLTMSSPFLNSALISARSASLGSTKVLQNSAFRRSRSR